MSAAFAIDLSTELRGRWLQNEPMARHTSWRCGGSAAYFFEPADRADLVTLFKHVEGLPEILWLGLGSNLLVRDGGLSRTVIDTSRGLTGLHWESAELLYAEAGVPCAKLARTGARADRAGLEFMAGVPGSLGGALAMNAGAHGSETWDFVAAVEVINDDGSITRIERNQFAPSYRSVSGPSRNFVAAWLSLPNSAGGEGSAAIKHVLGMRGESQPTGQASCGSVFMNPPGDFAGRLIESCGLKGHRIGGATVSHVHANFIVNEGSATATDIEQLINFVRRKVESDTGVLLQPEVQIFGEKPIADAVEEGS